LIAYSGLLLVAWLGGLVWFVAGLDAPPLDPDKPTDAIVVLTGGSQRLETGLAALEAGKARKLFVSGVHPGVSAADMFRGDPAASPLLACCIVLGHAADNTVGNAVETADWLRAEGYHSLRLVTANYHMRRALLEFRRVLPSGLVILPDPVYPEAAKHGQIWPWRGTARVIVVEYLKYLGALVRPLLWSPTSAAESSS
jgi:uncharacterized SAM-binding protein YcdF (DUF218 family)